jgi:hypothetical protein
VVADLRLFLSLQWRGVHSLGPVENHVQLIQRNFECIILACIVIYQLLCQMYTHATFHEVPVGNCDALQGSVSNLRV